jgi:uncharacterized membrane protein YgdD (TMEM256/DUF423 family)
MTFTSDRLAQRLGAILGFFGVALGALAAHGPVHDFLDHAGHLDFWRTGLTQQWFHALALLAISYSQPARRGVVICWLVGVVFFSGSLYILALNDRLIWVGPFTPLGGLFLLVGWGWLWVSLARKSSDSTS